MKINSLHIKRLILWCRCHALVIDVAFDCKLFIYGLATMHHEYKSL